MRQQAVKVRAALVDDRRQLGNLRARAHNDQELQPAIVLKLLEVHMLLFCLFFSLRPSALGALPATAGEALGGQGCYAFGFLPGLDACVEPRSLEVIKAIGFYHLRHDVLYLILDKD